MMYGNVTDYWLVDFPEVEATDSIGQTKFVVGGRIYFEAKTYGNATDTFVTQGFFDKEGYVEPVSNSYKRKVIIYTSTSLLIVVCASLGGLYYFFCYKKE